MAARLARFKNISVDDALRFFSGKEFAINTQANLMARGAEATRLGRFAAGPVARAALRAVPIISTGLVALDAADIVTNDTNIGNKIMDTAAMGIGGVLGGIAGGGPVGAMAGASTGKWASDSLQWLFGDKKTPEQRKMEEALAILGAR